MKNCAGITFLWFVGFSVLDARLQFCFVCLSILQWTIFLSPFQNRSINTRPLFSQGSFFLSPSCVFVSVLLSLSFSTLSPPSANSNPSLPVSRTNKQCSKLRHEGWLSAQCVQLASISRQGGKDDRERCWNESSVWAPSLFNLSY